LKNKGIHSNYLTLYQPETILMKYFNKTRTIEQKVTDREVLALLNKQSDLLEEILKELKKLNQ